MRPAFDESVAAENFLDPARWRSVQVQELHIMAGVGFVDRRNVRGVIIEGGEPFLFLFLRPIVFRRSDVIIRLVGSFLEWARCVHRGKRGGPQILRRLFDLRADVRWDADQVTVQNVLPNIVQVFGGIGNEFFRRWMFALDLLEDFDRRLVGVDLFRGFGKRILFCF